MDDRMDEVVRRLNSHKSEDKEDDTFDKLVFMLLKLMVFVLAYG